MDEVLPVVPAHTLVRPIGKGAFGCVWLARNVVGTYRAVKIVSHTSREGDQDFHREFNGIQKFEPVSRLHDGLVDVLQIGHADDESYFYYVMELGDDVVPRQEFSVDEYEPRTLAAECRRRQRIPAHDAALIGAQLAGALAFLHNQALIHRDIKPSNTLFIGGHAKIGDPGLVTGIEASRTAGGTFGYIPPEGPGTPQADIFSLGKLLYVISTGKEPNEFPRLPPEMMSFQDSHDLRRLNLVILRACAYNPEERYATAEALRKDLLEVHAGGSPEETRRRLRFARQIGIALLVLVAVIGLGYYRAFRQASAERSRLAESFMDSVNRIQEQRDPLGALPFLAETLTTDPSNEKRTDMAARLIGFTWRYSPRLLRQWSFPNAINQVAINNSGHIGLAGAGGQVWLWVWRMGPPQLLGIHGSTNNPAEAESVAFSPNEDWLLSIGLDGVLRGWPIGANSKSDFSIRMPGRGHAIALRPKTNQVAVGGDGFLVLVNLDTRKTTNLHPDDETLSVAFSPKGDTLFAGTRDGKVLKIDPNGALAPESAQRLWVYDLAVNKDASLIAAATGNRARLNPLEEIAPAPLQHPTLVRSVSFDPTQPSGKDRLLTSCFDNTVRLWSCADNEERMSPIHTAGIPMCVRFFPDGETFTIATSSGLVRIYNSSAATDATGTNIIAVSGDTMHYATLQGGRVVHVRNATTDYLKAPLMAEGIPDSTIYQLRLDQSAQRLLVAHSTPRQLEFNLWDLVQMTRLASTNFVAAVKNVEADLAPDAKSLIFRLTNGLTVWNLEENRTFHLTDWEFPWPWAETELRFSENTSRAVVGWSTNVMVFSTSGKVLNRWSVRHPVATVDINVAGDRVLVGDQPTGLSDSRIHVWIPDSNGSAHKLNPEPLVLHDGCFLARFNPSGPQFVLTDQANDCNLYDLNTWKLFSFRQPPAITVDATFSLSNPFLATMTGERGGASPAIRVWNYETHRPLTPFMQTGSRSIGSIRFLGGASSLLWFNRGGQWRRWRLDPMDATTEELVALSHLLSCHRIFESGESIPLTAAQLDLLWSQLYSVHPDWFAPANR